MKKVGRKMHNSDAQLVREMEAWELRLKGYDQITIGKMLDVSQYAVSTYLKKARLYFQKLNGKKIKQTIWEQVAFHERVAQEAMISWEKSKSLSENGKARPTRIVKKTGKQSIHENQMVEYMEQYGDPRFLKVAMDAKEKIRKILGTDAPIKIQNESTKHGTISVETTADLISQLIGTKFEGEDSIGSDENKDG
jgi:hypothetical protein